MKIKYLLLKVLIITFLSCTRNIEYTQDFKDQVSGGYLYSPDELISVSFNDDNKLQVEWRGRHLDAIAIDAETFTVIDMNKKLKFTEKPETSERYISDITKNEESYSYDYKKVADTFNVPSAYLKAKKYKKALIGYQAIQKADSLSIYVKEREFNSYGYKLLRELKFEDAIEVFKINIALYPDSDNVYDSLGDAYARSGDSLQAYNNYKKALELNNGNRGAKRFVEKYEKK